MKPAYQQRDIVVEIAARATPGDRAIAVTSRRRPTFHFNNFSQPTKLRYLPFIGYLRDWLSRDYLALSPTHLLPPPCPHLGNSNLQAAALHAPERPRSGGGGRLLSVAAKLTKVVLALGGGRGAFHGAGCGVAGWLPVAERVESRAVGAGRAHSRVLKRARAAPRWCT